MSAERDAVADAVEHGLTRLVQQAPDLDRALVAELGEQLYRIGSPLAVAIARVLELVAEDLVDPGIALPALAMAGATLAARIRGTLGDRELEAARYEIETLMPLPDGPRPVIAAPDVPVTKLSRGPRRQT
ncbi:MAG TPA: hypothetical protein VFQ53_14510 [Kofleriaceae bacterium]|nr:hypothetical protein [Kofleriaceae bacterium]